MIRFHGPFETVVMVSPEMITHIRPDHEMSERSRVYFGDNYITLRESVEEVARKVQQWKLAMIDYHHNIPSVKIKAMAELVRLAGLEVDKHELGKDRQSR